MCGQSRVGFLLCTRRPSFSLRPMTGAHVRPTANEEKTWGEKKQWQKVDNDILLYYV